LAIHSSGAALMTEDLLRIPAFLALSRATLQVIRQNLFWAFSYNLAAVPLARRRAPPDRRRRLPWRKLLLVVKFSPTAPAREIIDHHGNDPPPHRRVALALGVAAWLLFCQAVKSDQYDDVERPKHRMMDDDPEDRDR
jgi:cbb3-type cytochrome oxidase maturation protein